MSNVKQPQDHKTASEPFVWTTPDGRTVTLKPFDRLPSGIFRKAKSMDEMEATFALIEAATDEAGLEVLDDVPIGDLDEIFEQWSDSSEATLPQS